MRGALTCLTGARHVRRRQLEGEGGEVGVGDEERAPATVGHARQCEQQLVQLRLALKHVIQHHVMLVSVNSSLYSSDLP